MWLQLSYLLLTLSISLILYFTACSAINRTVIDKKRRGAYKLYVLMGLGFWHLYVYLMSKTGIFSNFDFPPRFALFLIFPLFIFSGIFIYKNRNKDWLDAIPAHWLIVFQSFRILVEIIFVYSVARGILNREVSIEGYNFDMLLGFSAPIIGLLFYKGVVGKSFVKIWNFCGLAILASVIFLFISSLYNPQLFGSENVLLPLEAVQYPYVLVAGFLMPVAVFVHLLSIAQLSQKRKYI